MLEIFLRIIIPVIKAAVEAESFAKGEAINCSTPL